MTMYEKLLCLKKRTGYHSERLYAQLSFAQAYEEAFSCGYSKQLEEQVDFVLSKECPTAGDVAAVEAALAPLSAKIKELTILAVSHAHIDMNWMWRYDETVSVTLSTFRTILDLMEEFPDFTFSQSQASVYRIVEKYDPGMLDEIRQRVAEGRWELAVSSWVETDKNMPSGEALCRHILYAKQYMNQLFGVDPDSLQLDFEPDTFGHNANVPQILAAGGVKYYYHCRGYDKHHVYRWRSADSEVLVYREPVWYIGAIAYDDFLYMPKFAKDNGMTTLMKVYGLGDHGGGPSRRDLNRLNDMMQWPLMPNIRFGTYAQFYQHLETLRENLPIVTGELNSFATGCYTTQTRIKRFNKMCEYQLYEAEVFDTLNHMQGNRRKEGVGFQEAWEHVLFNDFHDILPGSGVIDTREHALGKYQECLGITSARKNMALSDLAAMIDTSHYNFTADPDSISAGAGVGFCQTNGVFSSADRNNNGKNRIYHLFNSTASTYTTPSVITVWDYPADLGDVQLFIEGKPVKHQLLDPNPVPYWLHEYQRIAVDAQVPAFGYTTVVLKPKTEGSIPFVFPDWPRLEFEDHFVLENNLIRVELNTRDCSISRLTDKRTGKDIIQGRSGYFRLITEDPSKEMTAWIVGRHAASQDVTDNMVIRPCDYIQGELIQSISYYVPFSQSHLNVTISLEHNSPMVKFHCSCDFGEKPIISRRVPQLSAYIPCTVTDSAYLSDIPFGTLSRPTKHMDMPSLNGVMVNTGEGNLYVISNSKYGFRTTDDGISVTLIRGSYAPDPLPDFGVSEFDFAIGAAGSAEEFCDAITAYNHPCSDISVKGSRGSLPEQGSFLSITGARITALKRSEDQKAYILRLYDCQEQVVVRLPFNVACAGLCDINERVHTALSHKADRIVLDHPGGVVTLRVEKA